MVEVLELDLVDCVESICQILYVFFYFFICLGLFIWALVHYCKRKLWVAIDNEVFDVLVSALVDEDRQELLWVWWYAHEKAASMRFKLQPDLLVVMFKNLALVKKFNEASDLCFGKVDDFMGLKFKLWRKKVQDHFCADLYLSFVFSFSFSRLFILGNNDDLLQANTVVMTL